ncbi:MAG: hydrogenase formation protein HypD, partial [Planctomycetota bacterium]
SLEQARAGGARVAVVYSPLAALEAARAEPARQVVFVAVGFETTAPAIAAMLRRAREERLANLSVLPLCKLIPPALRVLLAGPAVAQSSGLRRKPEACATAVAQSSGLRRKPEACATKIDGLLLPGHVSVVLGARPYEFIPREFGVPCVITGFEPVDILQGLWMLLRQMSAARPAVEIAYRRAVAAEGNPAARALLDEVFVACAAEWRAVGVIPDSGLALRPPYEGFDAARRFPVEVPVPAPVAGCLCGEILTGRAQPRDCRLLGKLCTPETPAGPCMVSSEGACAAAYQYGVPDA